MAEITNIDKVVSYSSSLMIGAIGISAGFFTIMVGGTFIDFIPSLIFGFLCAIIKKWFFSRDVISYLVYFISGFTIGGGVILASWVIPNLQIDSVVIGSIMPLVPGVAFTNAIRDMIGDELISGLSRGVEALFIAVSVAAGVGIAMNIFHSIGGFAL